MSTSPTSNLGTIPASFTAPASCEFPLANFVATAVDWGLHYKGPLTTSPCFPAGDTPSLLDYFSPATKCPSSYYIGPSCSTVNGQETTITCCPAGMACYQNPNNPSNFKGALRCGSTVVFASGASIPILSRGEVVSSTTYTDVFLGFAHAYGVRIRYQATDTAQASATMTVTTTVTASSQAGDGLGSDTVAGIAVASAVGAFAISGLAIFTFWKRRGQPGGRNSKPVIAHGPSQLVNANQYRIAEAPGSNLYGGTLHHGRTELAAHQTIRESRVDAPECPAIDPGSQHRILLLL